MRIYSEVCDDMIVKSFFYKGYTWTWCEDDAIYYRDDVDDAYLDEMPLSAIEIE